MIWEVLSLDNNRGKQCSLCNEYVNSFYYTLRHFLGSYYIDNVCEGCVKDFNDYKLVKQLEVHKEMYNLWQQKIKQDIKLDYEDMTTELIYYLAEQFEKRIDWDKQKNKYFVFYSGLSNLHDRLKWHLNKVVVDYVIPFIEWKRSLGEWK